LKLRATKIAIIDNSLDHAVYNPIRHWKSCLEMDFEVFKATDNEFPEIRDFTHMILTGSEASILQRERWATEEIDLVKSAAEKGVCLLGSCWGHQLLAVALAGPRHVRKCPEPEIGWISIAIHGNAPFLGEKRRAFCFSSHSDEVTDLPDEFCVLASTNRCQIQAFQYKNESIWGLQMHPEINIDEAKRYLERRVANKHDPLPLFQAAFDSQPKDSRIIFRALQNFLD
jgi:GMP synthase-like glutamine amidotransferase